MRGGGYLRNNTMKSGKLATTWGRGGMPEASTKSRKSAVSMVTRPRPGHSGFRIPVGARDVLFLKVQTNSVTHPAWGTFPGVKRPEFDADQSSPSSFEVKNECSYTPAPPI